MFARNSKFIVSPSSPEGSYHPSSCTCSEAGGFEAGSATGMLGTGCQPCKDGYFSLPNSSSGCQPCPNNTYASISNDFRDFLKCPNASSPKLAFPTSTTSGSGDECFTVKVGATSCTPCPLDRPYTMAPATPSKSMCMACPTGHYQVFLPFFHNSD